MPRGGTATSCSPKAFTRRLLHSPSAPLLVRFSVCVQCRVCVCVHVRSLCGWLGSARPRVGTARLLQ
jgi:hypothetical protein